MTYKFDPELAEIVPLMPRTNFSQPERARSGLLKMTRELSAGLDNSGLDISDRSIPGFESGEVSVRVYTPANCQETVPALLYIHGGGFVVGSIETEHGSAVMIAKKLGIVVVSVEYRLAPEHPFPAGLEDCYASLTWLHENAEELKVDRQRIGIFGQSAGAGLSAGVTLMARDRKGPEICFQYLGVPELDDRLDTVSMTSFVDTPVMNRATAELSWKYYLGDSMEPGSENVSPYAAPARAKDLSGLPPAFVSTMEFDPLRDEGVIYALGLMQAGVPVELHSYPGTFHGSSLIPTASISRRQHKEMLEVLRRGLNLKQ